MQKRIMIYDDETGEVMREWEEKVEKNTEIITGGDSRRFIKMFRKTKMEFQQSGFEEIMTKLVRHLEINTNRLSIEHYRKDNEPLQIKDMMKITGVSRTTIYEFLKDCNEKFYISYSTIGREKFRSYFVNPLYYLNCRHITVELYMKFEKDPKLSAILNEKDKKKVWEYTKHYH